MKLHIDDSLDVFSIHGIASIVGALSCGFFGSKAVNPSGVDGVFYGGDASVLGMQFFGVFVVVVWTTLMTIPMFFVLMRFKWFSLQVEDEKLGLDHVDHEISAYKELEEEEKKSRGTFVSFYPTKEHKPVAYSPAQSRITVNEL